VAQGGGPAKSRLEANNVDRFLSELPQTAYSRAALGHLDPGHDQSGRWLGLTREKTAANRLSIQR
jgi:hypothetical protein